MILKQDNEILATESPRKRYMSDKNDEKEQDT